MQGVQDTYYLNKGDATAYFEDCHIAGEVDFIYGDGTALFSRCTIEPLSAKAVITAPNTQPGYTGLVFKDCTVKAHPEAKAPVAGFRLGRPWDESPAATFLSTTFVDMPAAEGWGAMKEGLTVRFHEYGSKDAAGAALDLSSRSIAACKASDKSDKPVLTAAEAAAYTTEMIFAKPAAGWQPAADIAPIAAPTPHITGTTLAWDAAPGATGYAVLRDGELLAFTTATTYTVPGDGHYSLRAVAPLGTLGEASGAAVLTAVTAPQIAAGQTPAAPCYNAAGQRVTPAAHGLIITNGRKRVK